mmetsp:Transcript_17453/g.46509  ORF Transcript_17453/g.46509 Transcript_17453/m.46509 type:complete len:226 (-) Transcript_17453:706-1383(-)
MWAEPSRWRFSRVRISTSAGILTVPSACIGALFVIAPLQQSAALRTALAMTNFLGHDLEEYIQSGLKHTGLRGLMEDVCEAAIAAQGRAIHNLIWQKPREVPHSERAERWKRHRTPTVHSSSNAPLWQPLLRRPEAKATLFNGNYGPHVFEDHVRVEVHVAPEDKEGDVRNTGFLLRDLQVLRGGDGVGEHEARRVTCDAKVAKLFFRKGDVVRPGDAPLDGRLL